MIASEWSTLYTQYTLLISCFKKGISPSNELYFLSWLRKFGASLYELEILHVGYATYHGAMMMMMTDICSLIDIQSHEREPQPSFSSSPFSTDFYHCTNTHSYHTLFFHSTILSFLAGAIQLWFVYSIMDECPIYELTLALISRTSLLS